MKTLRQSSIIKLLPCLLLICSSLKGQISDSIYVHLYTDSLKKGSFNYISIDGKLPDGRFTPLDSSELEFSSSAGTFHGNSLYIPIDCNEEKVDIAVRLKRNTAVIRTITLYIKRASDNSPIPTEEEFYRNSRKKKRAARKSGRLLCVFQELRQPDIG
jgi:hypothetical protein